MPFSSSNTGSTDLRLTEVQQPNTAATFSFCSSSRAFSANSGQFDAGSTTTASSLRPRTPPFLFCSSISISMTSLRVVSLIAIVPDSECKMPTLIGAPWANALPATPASRPAATRPVRMMVPNFIPLSLLSRRIPPRGTWIANAVPNSPAGPGKLLVGDQDEGAAGQDDPAQGPQSQVANVAPYNPAESQPDRLQQGSRRQ